MRCGDKYFSMKWEGTVVEELSREELLKAVNELVDENFKLKLALRNSCDNEEYHRKSLDRVWKLIERCYNRSHWDALDAFRDAMAGISIYLNERYGYYFDDDEED